MKIFGYFITIVLLSRCVSVNTGADPVQSKQKGTFILAQIDSISQNGVKVFFTPIQLYTSLEFRALQVDGSEYKDKSDFYNRLTSNNFREGMIEKTPTQLKRVKSNELYLLVLDIHKSNREELIIKDIINPNMVKLSTLVKLE